MLLRPTRVREKPARFHVFPPEYAKNAPDFTLPNKDIPKTCPVLGLNRRRETFRGVCFCAPTRIRQKRTRFHYPQLRVREKPARFHISTHVPAKNPPDFPFPNKDTPKTCLFLGPNPCRKTFWGVCNTPLHGYVQNLTGFRSKPSARNILGAYAIRPYTGT